MALTFSIPKILSKHFQNELELSTTAFVNKQYATSWKHLERAHILGQAYPIEHSYAHWRMLVFGIRLKNWKETIGQIPRLLVGGVKSFVGIIPVGNTGGANVSALKPMKIPEDLRHILDAVNR